jgi:hypothetical protein
MAELLHEDQVYKIMAALGRKGGLARAKKLTAERRKEITTKASKAAAKARSNKAAERKRERENRESHIIRASMASWYKITFRVNDCVIGGKGQRLQDAFLALLIANGGTPWTAALFSQLSNDYNRVYYYASPDAMQIARVLIESYGATACDQPPRPSTDVFGVRLSVGDARVFELLWPSIPAEGT